MIKYAKWVRILLPAIVKLMDVPKPYSFGVGKSMLQSVADPLC
jgi:hypothetical protein